MDEPRNDGKESAFEFGDDKAGSFARFFVIVSGMSLLLLAVEQKNSGVQIKDDYRSQLWFETH